MRAPPSAKPTDQRAAIAFLADPASHGVERVERLETHGNLVFLAGSHALKIKRAVRFDYMDFSTLEKRRVACQREVELNRRWAPNLYLGCVPIKRRPDGALAFEGTGEIIEWAVRMQRFEQSELLSAIAAEKHIDGRLAGELANAVYASHRDAPRAPRASASGTYRTLAQSIVEGLAKYGPFDARAVVRLNAGLQYQLDRAAPVIDKRAALGFLRRCHGDLHLANIVLRDGRPVLYDALEFDENLATIDTLYDLAFLLMDLDFRGLRSAANTVLNRYLWRSRAVDDIRGLAALPLFLAVRAAVRARVATDRARQEAGQARDGDLDQARGYLNAAIGYVEPEAPRLIAIGGLSGTGKTTLATALATRVGPAPGAVHFRSDLERKALAGVGELDRLPAASYTLESRRRVYQKLHEMAAMALRARHSVILDAVYDDERERREVESLAGSLGIRLHGLWLEAAPPTLLARVTARRNDASDATSDVIRAQLDADTGRLSGSWTRVQAGGSATQTMQAALSACGLAERVA